MSLCLRLIILADRLGPRSGPTKCDQMVNVLFITKALIRMCGTQAGLQLCWSPTTKSGRVGRIFANVHCFH